jgi:hypothetical protein
MSVKCFFRSSYLSQRARIFYYLLDFLAQYLLNLIIFSQLSRLHAQADKFIASNDRIIK